MKFSEAIFRCLTNPIGFKGRASRSEYWWFTLFGYILGLMIFIATILFGIEIAQPIANFLALALIFPALSVSIRRLHDINRSGWWALLILTGIGVLILFVGALIPGDKEENSYGLPSR